MTNRFNALLGAVLLVIGTWPRARRRRARRQTPASRPRPRRRPNPQSRPQSEAAESEAPAAEAERVRIDGSAFDPEELTIAAGTEVQFVNADGFAHTVTEGTDGQAVADPIVDEEIAAERYRERDLRRARHVRHHLQDPSVDANDHHRRGLKEVHSAPIQASHARGIARRAHADARRVRRRGRQRGTGRGAAAGATPARRSHWRAANSRRRH